MKAITDFFNNVSDFRDYVPFVGSDIELSELNPSAIPARKQIRDIITPSLYTSIQAEIDTDAWHHLKMAFGNLTMHKAVIFTTIAKRMSGGADVYKYELEKMQRQYIDNYFNAMDSLLCELDTNKAYSDRWHATTDYKYIDSLRIKTTAEFNSLYGIDMSYLFFFRTISIQREVLDDSIGDFFARISGREADFETKLKRALALLVVSVALFRFDIIELPPTIRNLFDEQKSSRDGNLERNSIKSLSASLQGQAMDILKAVDLALMDAESANVDSTTTFNREDDKFFLMS